jgi:Mor family transcriptional regulator
MDDKKWLSEMSADMLPAPYDEYARILGIENLYELTKALGGTTVYIPKVDSLFRTIREKKIREEFNGYNYQELAIKYRLCERTIRYICSNTNPVLEGQISLFNAE